MKIKSVTIQGFRGFNEERIIEFDDSLTLIYAPNSYGKTSISEAFELLLYGITYKVATASSKEEYRGSYRNRHLPESESPFIKAVFTKDDETETEFRVVLDEDENIKRFVGDQEVKSWPLSVELSKVPRPFILQHALKHLILAKPDERFQRFASLLGLERLDLFQRNVISLCTKPDACIPTEVDQFLNSVGAIEARLAKHTSLTKINKALEKGVSGLAEAYRLAESECKKRVPLEIKEKNVLPHLLRIREEAIAKIFEGSITLPDFSEAEAQANSEDESFFINSLADPFAQKYTEIIALAAIQHIFDRASFFELGVKLLDKASKRCPFCGQEISDELIIHVQDVHSGLENEKKRNEELRNKHKEVIELLEVSKSRLTTYHNRHIEKSTAFLSLKSVIDKLQSILVPKYESHFNLVKTSMSEIEGSKEKLEACYGSVVKALSRVDISVKESKEDIELLRVLGDALTEYIASARSYAEAISRRVSDISDADQILRHELDTLAGTEDISVLIEFTEQRLNVERKLEIEKILAGLKSLRKSVDQFVATKVLQAITGEMTSEVMDWYEQIRTTGDPDVHFDGFDIDRTKTGELKARRVSIKARSYGKDLTSAVSSLSESKLNALGLCVSVASNLKGESPFDFLIIDDPIQSWDAEHETQFIGVVRKLVERGKQVVLMSHSRGWIERVCQGCRTINGRYYEITGYTESGPHLREISWVNWKDRLKEVDAILKDATASSVTLQQAEEEIRIVVAELTCELYCKVHGMRRRSSDLNSAKTRKMLVECGVDNSLIDRVTMTFQTTDDAHHAPENYEANRQRIREYHSWAHELAQKLG